MKTKAQRINEIESSHECNNWRYDRNKLRDLLDAVWREGMTDASDVVKFRHDGTLGMSNSRADIVKRIIQKRDGAMPNRYSGAKMGDMPFSLPNI